MASINDVAKLAGVSKSTVSKVLNNYQNVTPKTKEIVLKAVDELNYVPNQIAVALAKNDLKKVALVVDPTKDNQTIDGINAKYLLGAVHKLGELNVELITVFSTLFTKYQNKELDTYLLKRGITGIIFFGIPRRDESMNYLIEQEKFKIVLVDVDKSNHSTSSLSINNYGAQQEIAKLVIDKYNFKKVLYISGDDGGDSGLQRKNGIKDLQKQLEITIDIMDGEYSELKAQKIVQKYGAKYEAIICASDLMAIGAVRSLKKQKLNRLVTGFDGIDLLAYLDDKILTVMQNFVFIGEQAAEEVVKLLDGKQGEKKFIEHEIDYVKIEDVIK